MINKNNKNSKMGNYNLVILVLLMFLISGCGHSVNDKQVSQQGVQQGMKYKILMIVAPKNFRYEELVVPKNIFENNNFKVDIASTSRTAVSMFGKSVDVDLLLEEALENLSKYKAVVLVGGSGSTTYFRDEMVHSIVREAYKQNKTIGAICLAPVILANAGLLENKRATVWDHSFVKMIEDKGAHYLNQGVVVDGSIVTANSPKQASNFANEILKNIGSKG